MARVDRRKRALGGAIKRSSPRKAAQKIVALGLARGRVLDFGCGWGFDARHFGWEAYDPYYGPTLPEGQFDTILCISVINALSRNNRTAVLAEIEAKLSEQGCAYLAVPRDIPVGGKLGMHHSLQNYVVLTLPSVFADEQLEIYALRRGTVFEDKTREYLSRRDRRRSQ